MTVETVGAYASLGCVELWNQARMAAYFRAGLAPNGIAVGCTPFEDLVLQELADPTPPVYVDPVIDDAPWYTPTRPESAGFAGFLVTSIEGWDSDPTTRDVVTTIYGGVSTAERQRPREIEVEGLLIGVSCCAVAYGLRWFTQALRGCCSNDCGGSEMCVLTCAPGSTFNGCVTTPDETSVDPWRTLFRVSVTESVQVEERFGDGCGCGGCSIVRVRFTLTAGRSGLHTTAKDLIVDQPIVSLTEGCRTRFCEPECSSRDMVIQDPNCPIQDPPEAPTPAPCSCEPWIYTRTCFQLDTQDEPFPILLGFDIYAGSKDMRSTTVRIFPDAGTPTPGDGPGYDACSACLGFTIGYLPAYSTLTVDPRARTIQINTGSNQTADGWNVISGLGGAFDWPVLACGQWVVCVDAPTNAGTDATMTVRYSTEEP